MKYINKSSRRYNLLPLVILLCSVLQNVSAKQNGLAFIDDQINQHKNTSGTYILEKGEQALLARAWLADNAQSSIQVQYFIWSTDNIGILASEALLRAAERGVTVKIIVDDLLIDAPDKYLLALALHPNIDIKIYNPKHSVGTSFFKRIVNIFSDFRSVNQRMHDKTFIVDGKVAITGGRNMADEYFDYNQEYNFRDRDALVIGDVVINMQKSFNLFWDSKLSVSVQKRFDGNDVFSKSVNLEKRMVQSVYDELHKYAQSDENFEDEVKNAINNIPSSFKFLSDKLVWGNVSFVSDIPGKNNKYKSFNAGGKSSRSLASLVKKAKASIIIQSPYLVLSDKAYELFLSAIKRGVKITISTNSLASTDNLQAFSGYRNQRENILHAGIKVYEYKPSPKIQLDLLERYSKLTKPTFALHAKSMVIDSKVLYIGTYNLDPRSENLNTEVGVVIENSQLAQKVSAEIIKDTQKDNSWSASENPDQYASFSKRIKVFFYQLLPIKAVL